MKNRFIVIYTIFAAAVFIFAMSFFGYNLFNEYTKNLKTSELRFTELANDIRTLSYAQDENTPAYSQGIKKAIGEASDFSYIHVRRNNETVILYPTGKSKEETISRLTKTFSTNLNVNKQNITIESNIYLIRPDSIFYYARISFLLILIITIITIIMIIYLNITETNSNVSEIEEDTEVVSEENEIEDNEVFSETEIETEFENEINTSDKTTESETVEKITEPETPAEIKNDSEEQPVESEPVKTEAPEQEEERSSEVTPEEVQAIFSEPLTDAQTEMAKLPIDEIEPSPAGLFDPETGIGWESYLMTRLDNEIDRATASEIDLSLFIIKLANIEKTSEEFKNVCNYLSIQFQFKDLLFEFKEDCIVAIKISMSVDEALALADKLYSDISNIVNNKDSRIGISSRSIRMVGGDRLLLEAEQSIEHSDADSPVIAFRVDSEKYRKLMEQNQA